MAVKQLRQKFWLGVNKKTSSTDVRDLEFTTLKNWNPFKTPGRLVPDKGYSKKFADSQTDCELLGSIERDNGDIVTVSNNSNQLVYWVNNGSRVAVSGTRFMANRRAINERNELRISGEGISLGSPTYDATTEPLWFARIDRERFNTSTSTPTYNQSIADYFMYPKRLQRPEITTSGASQYAVNIAFSTLGSGSYSNTNYYKLSFIYDGFQESALSEPTSNTFASIVTLQLTVEVANDINRRITGINVYRSTDGSNYYLLHTKSFVTAEQTIFPPFTPTYLAWTVNGSSNYEIVLSETELTTATELYNDRIEYTETINTSAFYKYGIIFQDRMYVADVSVYNADDFDDIGLEDRDRKRLIYSPLYQYDLLPQTLSVRFPDDITGLGYTDNHVLVFTRKDVFFLYEGRIADRINWNGCVAPDSIAQDGRYTFWLSESGVKMWQGVTIADITYNTIKNVLDDLTDAEKEQAYGVIDPNEKEYCLFLPSENTVWVYNMNERQWRERDYTFNYVINDVNGDLIATDGTYIHDLLDGYDYDGTGYECTAVTKEFELNPNSFFDLRKLWIRHKNANGNMQVKFTIDKTVERTVALDTQATEKMDFYTLVATSSNDPLRGRNIQMEFELTAVDGDDSINMVAIDFIERELF